MLLSVWATTLSGCTAMPQSSVHQNSCRRICPLVAIERHLGDAGDMRAGVVDIRHPERAAGALAAPSPPSARRARPPWSHAGSCPACSSRKRSGSTPRLRASSSMKRFGRELVGDETDPAQRRGAHAGVLIDLLDQLVGHVVAGEVGAGHQDAVAPLVGFVAHRIEERRHAIADMAVMPRHKPARCIESRPQVMRRQRAEAPVLDVVLARPHHLHGPAGILRQQHRIDREVGVARAAPAETAAHQVVVELDLVAARCRAPSRSPPAPWSGSGCRSRFRRCRPTPKPTPPRSAAPSGRDRRSRSDRSHPSWRQPCSARRGGSPALNQSVAGCEDRARQR